MYPFNGCCFELKWFNRKNQYPIGQTPHGGRRRSVRRRKYHHVRGWTRLEPPSECLCTVPNSSADKGVMVSLHLGSPEKPSAKRRSMTKSCFKRFGAFICGRV